MLLFPSGVSSHPAESGSQWVDWQQRVRLSQVCVFVCFPSWWSDMWGFFPDLLPVFFSWRCLPSCPTLVSLDLSGNPSVTSAGLHSLLASLRVASRPLTLLNLKGVSQPDCFVSFYVTFSVIFVGHLVKTSRHSFYTFSVLKVYFFVRLSGVRTLEQRRTGGFSRAGPGSPSLLSGFEQTGPRRLKADLGQESATRTLPGQKLQMHDLCCCCFHVKWFFFL